VPETEAQRSRQPPNALAASMMSSHERQLEISLLAASHDVVARAAAPPQPFAAAASSAAFCWPGAAPEYKKLAAAAAQRAACRRVIQRPCRSSATFAHIHAMMPPRYSVSTYPEIYRQRCSVNSRIRQRAPAPAMPFRFCRQVSLPRLSFQPSRFFFSPAPNNARRGDKRAGRRRL